MIYCFGEVLVDIFKEDGKEIVFPGGAPFNVASNINYWKGNVLFCGSVGNDNFGKQIINFAKENNLNTELNVLQDKYTTQAVVTLNNGERSFKFVRENGADFVFDLNKISNLQIKKDDIVHIGSLMLSNDIGKKTFDFICDLAHKNGAKISFDVNYRDDIFESHNEAIQTSLDAIKKADIVKISKEEIDLLSNIKDIKTSLGRLLNNKQICLISLGKDGSLFYHDSILMEVPTIPVKSIDTTGAGDAFYSAFLYFFDKGINLSDKDTLTEILKICNIIGGIATLKKGAINVVPSIEEAVKLLY